MTIAVTSEEEWQRFCAAIGNPEWTKDKRFAEMPGRWQNQDELNRLIEAWTMGHNHYAVQQILQQAGVAAGSWFTRHHIARGSDLRPARGRGPGL